MIQPWHGGPTTKHIVYCQADDCKVGPSVMGETRTHAIRYWNIRRGPKFGSLDTFAARLKRESTLFKCRCAGEENLLCLEWCGSKEFM